MCYTLEELDMEDSDLLDGFDNLKISAFTKYSRLNKEDLKNVTIGPNRTVKDAYEELYESISQDYTTPKKSPNGSPTTRSTLAPVRRLDNCYEKDMSRAVSDATKEEEGLPIREIFKDFENERLVHVQNVIRLRLEKIQEHKEMLEKEARQKWLRQQEKFIQNMQREEENIIRVLKEDDANKIGERQKLVKYYQNLAEQRKKNAAELEAKEKEQRELSMNVENIKKIHMEFSNTYTEILNSIKACQENELRTLISEECKQLKTLLASMEEIVTKCKTCKIDISYVKRANDVLVKTKSLKDQILTAIIKLKSSRENVSEAKVELPVQPPIITSAQSINSTQPAGSVSIENSKTDPQVTSKLEKYISRENLKIYTEIMEFMEQHTQSFKELSDNQAYKQFRFDCKKAINIPVNAISAVSPQHLRDKYERLANLLLGNVVRIGESSQFSAARHPLGVAFCIDLLAKKMVLQGDLMISSNPESAFCYATIIVSIWNTVPDFGKLLLGYFYKGCPYLVPFNIPRSVGQSDEEFYKSQGYQYVEGQIEKQDKYLKRMTGLMRLYAAIIITKPKSDQRTHPHGIENGWRWLASILKLEPRLDITATMLHTFLEVTGYHMQLQYGKNFQKLLKIIITKFIPIMKRNDSGGPVTRLEVLLQEYRQKGHFDKPEGTLENFW